MGGCMLGVDHFAFVSCLFFFFQAEDGIRDIGVTGVQTCALPILGREKFENGTFSKLNEKSYETYKKQMDSLKEELGRDDSGEYKATYANKYKDEVDKAERYLAAMKKAQADLASLQAQFKDLSDRQDKFFADT